MRLSPETLAAEAEATGFRPDVLGEGDPATRSARSHPKSSFPEGKARSQRRDGAESVRVRGAETVRRYRPELCGRRGQRGHAGRASQDRGGDASGLSAGRTLASGGFLKTMREANGRSAIPRLPGRAAESTWTSTTCTACLCGLLRPWTLIRWAAGGQPASLWWTSTSLPQARSRLCWPDAGQGICLTAAWCSQCAA